MSAEDIMDSGDDSGAVVPLGDIDELMSDDDTPTDRERVEAMAAELSIPPIPGYQFVKPIEPRVAEKTMELIVLREAHRLARQLEDDSQSRPPLDIHTLEDYVDEDTEPDFRFDGIVPSDAGTAFVGSRKTTKTTLLLNAAKSGLTGEKFLGRFEVKPINGTVGFLNFEVSGHQFARWALEHGFTDPDLADLLVVANLRGVASPLAPGRARNELAARLRDYCVETLIVDPFGRAFTGTNQNDAGEVSRWLGELDTFARTEVGARDIFLAVHAGWEGERTRGSSALEDWADSIVNITKDKDGNRFLRAEGRDVLVEEDALRFDPATRTLTLAGTGSRTVTAAHRRQDELLGPIVAMLKARPSMSGAQVKKALKDAGLSFTNGEEARALTRACDVGILTMTPGLRGAKHYVVTETVLDFSDRSGTSPRSGDRTSPPPFRAEGSRAGQVSQQSEPSPRRGETS